jgi:oligopeptide/dipeptide ABC transporter ATP-binding protein
LELKEKFALSLIVISHDLAVVEYLCDRILVMYLGKVIEQASFEALYQTPKHPYTQALLSAAPVSDPFREKQRILLEGDVPSPIDPPSGCRFHTRCPKRMEHCRSLEPQMQSLGGGHRVACHLYSQKPEKSVNP